ncbi:argininosuccinate lyase [Catellatospora methionotrophica]|uniref:Argininosuccinate lyase n=1 Tax=Catellatospora methionotrophica TaxID=121620 RepID=A0A8J3PHG3_9ACTN|nr:ATP-grasp domain-containing protein [Catellatospora methionotrophica]GIG16699.1 argininosuccinate lyase [Catellatospora methionotrophica]
MRVLFVGGGSAQQPRLRRIAQNVSSVVLCRASVLEWVHQLPENEAVVILNDDADLDKWLAAGRYLHRQWPLDAVAALAEIDQDKAAAIAEDLGLRFHARATVQAVHDKTFMRERLRASGLEDVPFRQVASLEQLKDFYGEVGPPLLLKPSRGRASTGIATARDETQLAAAFDLASGATAPRLEPSPPIAERYVEGPEFSVEAVTHDGHHYIFAIVEKFKEEISKVETGHLVPARISPETAQALVAHVRRCLSALGVQHGITHSELILGVDGPFLVETHLRQAGDSIVPLTESATGVDICDLHLRQIVGEDLAALPDVAARAQAPQYIAGSAIGFLVPDAAGRLDGIDGLDEARQVDGVVEVKQLVPDGTAVDGLTSSYSRLASVRADAADGDGALKRVEEALALLRVRIVP